MWVLVIVFVLGALTVVGAEALGAFILMRWLNRKLTQEVARSKIVRELSSPGNVDPSYHRKQGFVWVLDAEKIPRASPLDKALRQQKGKKEILEVTPIKKYAKLRDHFLILTESDASHTEIELKGCTIAAVSASDLSSRKWAKRYPIKVERKSSIVYKGSKTMYIYLETSWEKESWCKALYLASHEDEEKLKWVNKLNTEFQSYLISLNAVYPSFMKPCSNISTEPIDKSNKLDGSSSKVRNFLRKLSKKSSKSGIENKANLSSREAPTEKSIDCSTEEIIVPSSLATLNASASRNQVPVISDVDSDDRASDEGTLCWNLLISRLFFDAKQNEEMRTSLQARIQRTLSNMRTPTYIGEVICTTVDLGNLPPYIHAMKVLPSDMTEIWMMEIEIEYSGGAIFEIETRLEVQDLELQEGGPGIESSSLDEVKADMLEGIEQFGENLKYSEETSDSCDHRDEGGVKGDAIKHSRNVTGAVPQQSRWKAIIHSIAKQVSQVPLTLGMRIASLRGIMRVCIKPPPSDQIWFGFTSMPDLDFQFEPFVGEHRIASGHIALFLISRLKVAIRETLVIPNCESVCLSWMLAEKEDWIPRKFAPFLWSNQEAPNTENWEVKRSYEANKEIGSSYSESCEGPKKVELSLKKPNDSSNTRSPSPVVDKPTVKYSSSMKEKPNDSSNTRSPSPVVDKPTVKYSSSMKELQVPLLHSEEQAAVNQRKSTDSAEYYTKSRQVELAEEQSRISEEDDGKPRRQGTRAKMISLSKKMSEKFEEKKRNIEEKGRNIVERMKGQQ